MIGLYDYMMAVNRYKRRNLSKDDAKILWAGISAASNSGADVLLSDPSYERAILEAYDELETQLTDGHAVDDMIDWTSKQDWAQKGLPAFEKWLANN